MTIVLTGTTGNLGSRVLHHLLTLVSPSEIIVSVFNPNSAAHDEIKKRGVDVRQSDYTKPETLEKAYKGADKLFLVSSPSFDSDLRVQSHTNAINAAKAVGVKHIYYTSLAFKSTSTAHVMDAHLRTEEVLKKSGVAYTIIREGVYVDSYPVFLGFFSNADKEVVLPGDGPVSWVSREDLAEGNAKALISDEFKNQTVYFVGPKAINLQETTAIISTILGRELKFRKVSDAEWLARLSAFGDTPKFWISTYPSLEKGDTNITDDTLEKLLGRPLTPFATHLKELVIAADKNNELSNWISGGNSTRHQ